MHWTNVTREMVARAIFAIARNNELLKDMPSGEYLSNNPDQKELWYARINQAELAIVHASSEIVRMLADEMAIDYRTIWK
jgi:hypothetical protein